jgi:hypothetical protein
MADPTTEINFAELRSLSGAERTRRFQAANAAMMLERDAYTSTQKMCWYVVDRDITPDQLDNIPPATPGGTRTPVLWVKFRHKWLEEVVVARGRYDYDGGTWTARLSSFEDGDSIGEVVAIAWTPIVAGERPWHGPTIRKNEADPW